MRAWGPLEWLLNKLPKAANESICVLGALSAEERCVAVPVLSAVHSPNSVVLLRISDPPSRYSLPIEERIVANRRVVESATGDKVNILERGLFDKDEAIASAFSSMLSGNCPLTLWIDITCLPKRYFFLLVKLALREKLVENLVVTYTQPSPGRYTEEHLAEDPSDVQPLPGFGLTGDEPEELIIAIGFEALGLPQLLGEYRDKRRLVLVPFPPGQPYSRRIWQTVLSIGHPGDENLKRVPAVDVFEAFDIIREEAKSDVLAGRPPALAPYGPKPISLAMCLYGCRFGSPVFYTQPRVYHPEYTVGIGQSWAYSLKRNREEVWFDCV
jgi:hypothetical protein